MKKFIAVLFVMLMVSGSAHTKGTINYDYVNLLLKHIQLSTGMPIPKPGMMYYPQIVHVSDDVIHSLVCKRSKTCAAWAVAKWNKIFLGPQVDLDTPEGDSILYHELVHVVQYYMHGNATTCEEWSAREQQAYMLQYNYAVAKGHNMSWIIKWADGIRGRCDYVK